MIRHEQETVPFQQPHDSGAGAIDKRHGDLRGHGLFKLALSIGIRREDIANIELGNLDLDKRELTFWESKKRRWWTVPLTVEVAQELKRYINTLPRGQKRLFTFTGRTAYNRLQRYLEKAGRWNPSIVSIYCREALDPFTIQELDERSQNT